MHSESGSAIVARRAWIDVARDRTADHDAGHREDRPKAVSVDNTEWQNARKKASLSQVRLHDLKHTCGRRLRTAGVPLETRKVLLGHKSGDITSHYSAPELAELIRAANAALKTQESTLLRVVTKQLGSQR